MAPNLKALKLRIDKAQHHTHTTRSVKLPKLILFSLSVYRDSNLFMDILELHALRDFSIQNSGETWSATLTSIVIPFIPVSAQEAQLHLLWPKR